MVLDAETVKQIYFHCENKDKDSLFHNNSDDLDIVEFANKVAAYVEVRAVHEAKREEHERCVELAKQINPQVATFLDQNRQYYK